MNKKQLTSADIVEMIKKRDRKRGKQVIVYTGKQMSCEEPFDTLKHILKEMIREKEAKTEIIETINFFMKNTFNSKLINSSKSTTRIIGNSIIYTDTQFFIQIPFNMEGTIILGRPKKLENPEFKYDEEKENYAIQFVDFFQQANLDDKKEVKEFLANNNDNPFVKSVPMFKSQKKHMEETYETVSNFLIENDEGLRMLRQYEDRHKSEDKFIEDIQDVVNFLESKGMSSKYVNLG